METATAALTRWSPSMAPGACHQFAADPADPLRNRRGAAETRRGAIRREPRPGARIGYASGGRSGDPSANAYRSRLGLRPQVKFNGFDGRTAGTQSDMLKLISAPSAARCCSMMRRVTAFAAALVLVQDRLAMILKVVVAPGSACHGSWPPVDERHTRTGPAGWGRKSHSSTLLRITSRPSRSTALARLRRALPIFARDLQLRGDP